MDGVLFVLVGRFNLPPQTPPLCGCFSFGSPWILDWARSSDWESAALARRRPRVQIPVGPFLLLVQPVIV